MDIQALGQLIIQRKRGDISEEEKAKRRSEMDYQKQQQTRESNRLLNLLQGPTEERTESDTQSFLQIFGGLSFFKEYLQEGNKAPVRQAFLKGEHRSYYKREFITRKGEKNNSFKIILEGQVGLYLEINDPRSPASKKQLLLIRKMLPGEPIEVGTLIENQTYVMTTQALTERVELLSISVNVFSSTFQKYETEKYEADINFLKGVPLFNDWPKRNLISLQMCISKFQVPRSQIIYQEGQPSHAVFIVKSGEFGQYRKRATWQKSGSHSSQNQEEKGEDIALKLSYFELPKTTQTDSNNSSLANIPEENQKSSNDQLPNISVVNSDATAAGSTLLKGMNKFDAAKKVTGFIAGSIIEMSSDLVQTFSVFDSFGEKELLNQLPRQSSIVCKSKMGELIQIKSRHFFVLAQENHDLKFSIMTKMMVDSKKHEISSMRHGLTFRDENEMLILDNHLEGMNSKLSSSPSTHQKASPQQQQQHQQSHSRQLQFQNSTNNSFASKDQFPVSSAGMNTFTGTSQNNMNSSVDHTRKFLHAAASSNQFHINKLQYIPPTSSNKINTAQIYFAKQNAQRTANASVKSISSSQSILQTINQQQQQTQQQQQSTNSPITPFNHTRQKSNSQLPFVTTSSPQVQSPELTTTLQSRLSNSISAINGALLLGQAASYKSEARRNSQGTINGKNQTLSPIIDFQKEKKSPEQTANNTTGETEPFSATSIVKLPPVPIIPNLNSDKTPPPSNTITPSNKPIGYHRPKTLSHSMLLSQYSGGRSLNRVGSNGILNGNMASSSSNNGAAFANQLRTRNSFNIENSFGGGEDSVIQSNRSIHMVNGLPTRKFSSRTLANSISYSQFQLNI